MIGDLIPSKNVGLQRSLSTAYGQARSCDKRNGRLQAYILGNRRSTLTQQAIRSHVDVAPIASKRPREKKRINRVCVKSRTILGPNIRPPFFPSRLRSFAVDIDVNITSSESGAAELLTEHLYLWRHHSPHSCHVFLSLHLLERERIQINFRRWGPKLNIRLHFKF